MADDDKMGAPLKLLLGIALILAGTVYGIFAHKNQWWVSKRVDDVVAAFQEVGETIETPWYLQLPGGHPAVETFDADAVAPGLVMLAGINADREHFVDVIDRDGTVIHSWRPNWFDIWPEPPEGVPPGRIPQAEPGAILHGVEIADNADVILNYEFLSTMRLDVCGATKWALPNNGHHSVFLAEDDTIWVGSEDFILAGPTGIANHYAPLNSWTLQQLDADGRELANKNLIELFLDNDLRGMLHLSTTNNTQTAVVRDTLHPNDIDVFPSDMASEIFAPGDLLISLRNINTVIVVDPATWKIKFRSTGGFLRQHDADFMPGDKIIVYDNHNMNPLPFNEQSSRIVEIDALTGDHRTYFEGQDATWYYSPTMGRQQPLPNGNLMVISPHQGRAMEVNPATGALLWHFHNVVDDTNNGLVTEAQVLPGHMDRAFFETARANCQN